MSRYLGTIVKMNSSGKWGFIDRKRIFTAEDGAQVSLDTTKDIYLHQDDCGVPLVVGLEVTFEIVTDLKRPNAYRATGVKPVTPDIELHVDEQHVDNPSIPMRSCLSSAMHKRVTEGLERGSGYSVLIVAKHRDSEGIPEIRYVRSWKQTFSITTFVAPGTWDVCIILYERTNNETRSKNTSRVLDEDLRAKFLEVTRRGSYEKGFPDLHEFAVRREYAKYSVVKNSIWNGVPIAAHTITVNVPEGIFAKEPSEALKAFGGYFQRVRIVDQCDLRRRLLFMFTVGWIPWIILEAGKRLVLLLFAFFLMLTFVKDWWVIGDIALEPAINVPMNMENVISSNQMHPFNSGDGPWFYFTPIFLIGYATMFWFLLQIINVVIYIALALLLVGAIGLGCYFLARFLNRRGRTSYYHRQAVLAERQSAALVCGDAPAVVSLTAVPLELLTLGTLFSVLKQKVCKPFVRYR